ncbi:MAG: AbrB/MazE/SpoVT family DNA-binding domain-containing protein [Calditrichaeota bacterium]|nr:MAG: AbrB/MazE/SpoVT family DNA-binding domain-containing protein [Calditrichota bacterium]
MKANITSTLTRKGQITLPKAIRKKLNLRAGDKVEFIMDQDGNVRLIPINLSIKQLKGKLSPVSKRVSLEEMQEAIEKGETRS